jgi:hypothetical protein
MIEDFIFNLISVAGICFFSLIAGVMSTIKHLQKNGLVRYNGEGIYHEPSTCNRCGGHNELKIKECIEGTMCEAETMCQSCHFEDYWSYGFFQSSQGGYNFCKKYKGGGK